LWANSEFARKLKVLQAEGFAHELGVLWASSELCTQTSSFAGELHASLAISEFCRQAQSFSGELNLVGELRVLRLNARFCTRTWRVLRASSECRERT